jgi:hypothetical protein
MKKILKILAIGAAAIGLLLGTVTTLTAQEENRDKKSADSTISILNYALKPVGYVQGEKFVKSRWDIELKNNEEANRSINIKIRFYDIDKNPVKEVNQEVAIKGGQTKKYSYEVLLDSLTAKKITATRAFVEKAE